MEETMNFDFTIPLWIRRYMLEYGGSQSLTVLRAVILLIVGLLVARLASRLISHFFEGPPESRSPHRSMVIQRAIFYSILSLFVVSAVREMGFDLSIFLGTAGILTVAIGFASQTSMSNFISGLFLIGERPFKVGDVIRVEQVTGEVLAIDSLSVKLRTFDNTYVRIPNESIIKSFVTTLTKFPIRRIDVQLSVALKEDMKHVKEVLFEVADRHPLCLEEPRPLFIFQTFGESAIQFQFSVWTKQDQYLTVMNEIKMAIKAAFDEADIEIPVPHRALYTGQMTQPFPVRVVAE
jgi:small-conductance mechanosensitive channel